MRSISVCPQGHILLRFGAATIHLTLEEFQSFIGQATQFLEKNKIQSSLEKTISLQKTDFKIH